MKITMTNCGALRSIFSRSKLFFSSFFILFFYLLAILPSNTYAAATIEFNFISYDGPGTGWNDLTPVAPIGGNPGTTLGEQRKLAAIEAGKIWAAALDSPVPIVVQAVMKVAGCNINSGGKGVSNRSIANFPGAIYPNTYYPIALANKLAGFDLAPPLNGMNDVGLHAEPRADDIVILLNASYGEGNFCGTEGEYYGFDLAPPGSGSSFISLVLHEMGHALGFASDSFKYFGLDPQGNATPSSHPQLMTSYNLDPETFEFKFDNRGYDKYPDIFSVFLVDTLIDKQWNQMTDKERKDSILALSQNIVWNGPVAFKYVADNLNTFIPEKILKTSATGNDEIDNIGAQFGPVPQPADYDNRELILVNDGVEITTNACEPILTDLTDKVALLDRGICNFTVKVTNAQIAGAKAVIVANNIPAAGIFSMGGDDGSITIPSIMISYEDGQVLKNALNSGQVTTFLVNSLDQYQGLNENYKLILPDGDLSHTAAPNTTMASAGNSLNLDVTPSVFYDMGWDGQLHCPLNSEYTQNNGVIAPLVNFNNCPTNVPNKLGPFQYSKGGHMYGGCTINDMLNACMKSATKGEKQNCISGATNSLLQNQKINDAQAKQIMSCSP